jgi:hypothetical protein
VLCLGNIYYNYGQRDETDSLDGTEPRGRSIKDCSGSPPPDKLDKHFWNIQGDNLVIDDLRVDVKEDTGDSTTIKVHETVLFQLHENQIFGSF